MADFLRIEGVRKSFDGVHPVLDGVSLSVRQGEVVALLGPSGCGKTTLLRSIAGLSPIDDGVITIGDRSMAGVDAAQRNVGVVFQNYALFPHMSVARNVAYGLHVRRLAKAEIAERVAETLALVGLTGFEQRRPKALSGGQQQRVALARALAIRPQLLLLDEPMSGLDPQLREGLRLELRALQQRLGITTLIVTHDQADAFSICDRVALMSKGGILQYDTAEALHERPATLEVATAFGRANALPCTVEAAGRITFGRLRVPAASDLPPGPAIAVIRPHHIRLQKAPGRAGQLTGVIAAARSSGEAMRYVVDAEGLQLDVSAPMVGPFWSVGDYVVCTWDAAALRIYPAP